MISQRIYIEPNANHRNHQNTNTLPSSKLNDNPLALHWAVQATTSNSINKALHSFLRSLQTNVATVPRLDHYNFIPNSFSNAAIRINRTSAIHRLRYLHSRTLHHKQKTILRMSTHMHLRNRDDCR